MILTFVPRAVAALLVGSSAVSASYDLDLTSSGTNTPLFEKSLLESSADVMTSRLD
jgi:hypothetical protein